MKLQKIDHDFSIFKVEELDPALLKKEFTFVGRTDKELSIIAKTENVPADTLQCEDGWSCFRIDEDAAFEKYGMIAFLSKIIAAEKTGVLVVATYDTDYLFIKKDKFQKVQEKLIENGCEF